MRTTRLSGSVLVVSGDYFEEHMTAVATGAGVVVIDTLATLAATRNAMEAIAAFTSEPVRYVINTHGDVDHVAGNALLARAGGVIVAHVNCARHLNERVFDDPASLEDIRGLITALQNAAEPAHRSDQRRRLLYIDAYRRLLDGSLEHDSAPPAVYVPDGARIALGNASFELRHLGPGHTDADLVVVVPEFRLVATGDLVLGEGYTPVSHAQHGGSVVGLQRAVNAIAALVGPDWCLVPGHGEIGGPSLLRPQREYLDALLTAVQAAKNRRLSLDEAKATLDVEAFRHHLLYDFMHQNHVEAAWRGLGEAGAPGQV